MAAVPENLEAYMDELEETAQRWKEQKILRDQVYKQIEAQQIAQARAALKQDLLLSIASAGTRLRKVQQQEKTIAQQKNEFEKALTNVVLKPTKTKELLAPKDWWKAYQETGIEKGGTVGQGIPNGDGSPPS
jgi:gamma-glutamylcysteine synthetase